MKNRYLMLLLLALSFGMLWFCYQYYSITSIGKQIEPDKADTIIILGAGVWESGPSPALLARVKKGKEIYDQGYAKAFILSGGLGEHPPSEAQAMKELLMELGVKEEFLYLEDQARNTEENIKFSKAIMDEQGWESAIMITDVFHMKRTLLWAESEGIKASGASAEDSVLFTNDALRIKYTIREILAVTQYHLYRLIGIF